jgi:hypothetical protein
MPTAKSTISDRIDNVQERNENGAATWLTAAAPNKNYRDLTDAG